MKLVFKEIQKKKRRYCSDNGEWLSGELSQMFSETSANVLVCRRDPSTVILEGNLQGKFTTPCDRCGQSSSTHLNTDFYYLITIKEEENSDLGESECSDEDSLVLHLASTESEIDLEAILKEQTYLAIPVRNLCDENCKGICPGCGVTLNSGKCECSLDVEGSPFAVLKKLKKN